MPRYIDADALTKIKFHPLPYTHITPSDADAESYKRGWNDAVDAIIECGPTTDVVERKWGKWELDGHIGEFKCSVCGFDLLAEYLYAYGSQNKPKYCPECGARMEGEKDG